MLNETRLFVRRLFFPSVSLAPSLEATGFCKQSSPTDICLRLLLKITASVRLAGHNVGLKLAEVARFLLIVKQISAPVVIMRARKLGRLEPVIGGGGEGPGIWLDQYANTGTRLGLGLNTAQQTCQSRQKHDL